MEGRVVAAEGCDSEEVLTIGSPSTRACPDPLHCCPERSVLMITMVVPTRNRAHTLRRVASSYYAQDGVSEIVFVIDAGTDDTETVIVNTARQFPSVRTKLVRNPTRVGASQSRNLGGAEA